MCLFFLTIGEGGSIYKRKALSVAVVFKEARIFLLDGFQTGAGCCLRVSRADLSSILRFSINSFAESFAPGRLRPIFQRADNNQATS